MAHHHQPAHILAEWACKDAYKLITGEPERVHQLDLDILADSQKRRKWPLCVQRKRATTASRRFTRSTPENTCCAANLNTMPRFTDPVAKGLALLLFPSSAPRFSPLPEVNSWSDLAGFAPGYYKIDANLPEDVLARRLDGPVHPVLQRLRHGRELDAEAVSLLLTFLHLAWTRSPTFMSGLARLVGGKWAGNRDRDTNRLANFMPLSDAKKAIDVVDEVIRQAGHHWLRMYQARRRVGALVVPAATLGVLVAPKGVQFIFGDNPALPHGWNGPPLLGGLEVARDHPHERVITYPIDPRHCVVVVVGRKADETAPMPILRIAATGAQVRTVNHALLTMADNEVVYPTPKRRHYLPDGVDPDAVPPFEMKLQ